MLVSYLCMDGPIDGTTDGWTKPLIEFAIKNILYLFARKSVLYLLGSADGRSSGAKGFKIGT